MTGVFCRAVSVVAVVVALAACSPTEAEPSAGVPTTAAGDVVVDPAAPLGPQLKEAARTGDAEAIAELLDLGADVSGDLGAGLTALHVAAAADRLEAIRALLAAGADVNGRTDSGSTPLMLASGSAGYDTVTALLGAGADPLLGTFSSPEHLPLHNAAAQDNVDAVNALLDAGVDIDWNNPAGNRATPLLIAAFNGAAHTTEVLLKRGADPTIPDSSGVTPLGWAVANEFPEVEAVLRAAGVTA